jgi:protein CpxP
MFRSTTRSATVVRPAHGMKQMMVAMMVAVAGTVAMSAWAEAPGGQGGGRGEHGMRHHGPRGGSFGFGGHGLFMGSPEQVDRGVDRLLGRVDASEAQRTQIKQIVRAAAVDLKSLHATQRGLREQTMQLFTAPVVDARAVEAARVQSVAHHDQASKRISQAMLDISTVLTPEQRVKLAEQVKQRQARMKERLQHRAMQRRGAASAPAQ